MQAGRLRYGLAVTVAAVAQPAHEQHDDRENRDQKHYEGAGWSNVTEAYLRNRTASSLGQPKDRNNSVDE